MSDHNSFHSTGKVLQVRYKPTGQVMAMKVLNKKAIVEADEVEKTMTEKNILIKLDSPFLVNLHFAFQTPGGLALFNVFILRLSLTEIFVRL